MKAKLRFYWNDKHPKGSEVEVDKIFYDPEYIGKFKVRVLGLGESPRYLAITWIVKVPEEEL